MTDLKTESHSTRITQTQPTTKRQSPRSASGGKESDSIEAESTTEAPPAKKPRTTKTKKTTQAASKPSNQTASTRVKLTWEVPPTIESTLQQFNEELNAMWNALDELKATVEQNQAQEVRSQVKLPIEPPKVQISDRPVPVSDRLVQPRPVQSAIPPFRPAGAPVAARQRRRRTLNHWMQSVLYLPKKNSELAIDAGLWIMAAAGLRIGMSYLVKAVPMLGFPVLILVFVPALLAAYAALFIPQANRIGIYRLLLVALGLFVGGRLL